MIYLDNKITNFKLYFTCLMASGSDLGGFSFDGSFESLEGFFLAASLLAAAAGFAFPFCCSVLSGGRPRAARFASARSWGFNNAYFVSKGVTG